MTPREERARAARALRLCTLQGPQQLCAACLAAPNNDMNGYAGVLEDEKRMQDLERRVAQIKAP